MFAAQHRCGVPKLHVTIRKAFGSGPPGPRARTGYLP
jgi:hypothetical protein